MLTVKYMIQEKSNLSGKCPIVTAQAFVPVSIDSDKTSLIDRCILPSNVKAPVLFLLIMTYSLLGLAATPWYSSRGDKQGYRRSSATGPKKGKIKWFVDLVEGEHRAGSPVVDVEGNIYFIAMTMGNFLESIKMRSESENCWGLYSYDSSGKQRWWRRLCNYGPKDSRTLLLSEMGLVVHTGNVVSLVDTDGHEKWKKDVLEYADNLILDRTQQKILFNSDRLQDISLEGRILDTFKFSRPPGHIAAIKTDGTIFLIHGASSSHLSAIDEEGTVLWDRKSPLPGRIISTSAASFYEVVQFNKTLFAATSSAVHKLDYRGNVKWTAQIDNPHCLSLNKSGRYLITSSHTLGVVKVSMTGKIVWRLRMSGIRSCPAVDSDGVIYFGASHKFFAQVDVGDSVHELWKINTSDEISGVAAISNNVVYVPAGERVYAVGH